jgi:hypothetical protein
MRRHVWAAALVLVALAAGRGVGGDPPPSPAAPACWWQRVRPAGGWHPYGGGLLHWWDPLCFPRGGGPDDYCRKPLPDVCWPAVPCGAGSGVTATLPPPTPTRAP